MIILDLVGVKPIDVITVKIGFSSVEEFRMNRKIIVAISSERGHYWSGEVNLLQFVVRGDMIYAVYELADGTLMSAPISDVKMVPLEE